MTGIKSSVGLISGIDYTALVKQLIELDKVPRNNLAIRTDNIQAEVDALTALTGYFITSSYMVTNYLNKAETFEQTDVASSNAAVLTAVKAKSGTPTAGSYTFTPVQMASAQQSIAQGVVSDSQALGKKGTITISNGRTLENDVELKNLNGGTGVPKGYVRITDGSGTRATIDLRSAQSMDDVINAINGNNDIDVWAELDGDHLVLTDLSGSDKAKLTVQDVSGGKTAAALGLAGVEADESGVIKGGSLYRLGESMNLSALNDGNGIVFDNVVGDFSIKCKDGSTVAIDFNRRATTTEIEAGSPEIHREVTIGDLLDTINNSKDANGNAGKIKASISEDGKRLVLTDTTTGSGTTTLSSSSLSPVLRSLGFSSSDGSASTPVSITSEDGGFTSRQLIGDLDSVLTSSLNGGYGISKAVAGAIEVQDRSGKTATIEFTQAEIDSMQTLDGAVDLMNKKLADAEVGVSVQLNDKKTGLQVVDTTGRTNSNLIFRDKVATTTTEPTDEDDEDFEPVTTTTDPHIAKSFGLDVNAAASSSEGTDLHLQKVSYATKLSEMNGGKGVTMAGGKIIITDSLGRSETLTINSNTHQTLGDIINAINGMSSIRVNAKISESGDGIVLEDTGGGSGNFSCMDADTNSKFAKDLHIAQTITTADADGKKKIDGTMTYSIEVTEKDTLEDIRKKLNELGGNFSASVVNDGSSSPYRLMITGSATGANGAMNIDLSCLGLSVENMSEAQDAIIVYGDPNKEGSMTLHSASNTFKNAINGIDLTINGTSTSPVSVTSTASSSLIKKTIEALVKNYNTFQEHLNDYTFYLPSANDGAGAGKILYKNRVAKQFQTAIPDVLLKRVYGIPGITSLQDIGISIRSNVNDVDGVNKETNKLTFDVDKFDALYASNPDAIRQFFFQEQTIIGDDGKETTIKTGWAQSFTDVADYLTGSIDGIVYKEITKMEDQMAKNDADIARMDARLLVKEQQMLKKFYAMEQAMAKMSADMSAVSAISTSWSSNYSSTGSTT